MPLNLSCSIIYHICCCCYHDNICCQVVVRHSTFTWTRTTCTWSALRTASFMCVLRHTQVRSSTRMRLITWLSTGLHGTFITLRSSSRVARTGLSRSGIELHLSSILQYHPLSIPVNVFLVRLSELAKL